ncbi:hypothetical protein [Myxococcus sp. Y35]|uniref:hypothetical protein n=1 Tax=Pseudomyxococcus flavus TaxID=3115648 RepID=UPI003CF2B66C
MTPTNSVTDVSTFSRWIENSTGTEWQVIRCRKAYIDVPGKKMAEWAEMTERFKVDLENDLGQPLDVTVRELLAKFTLVRGDFTVRRGLTAPPKGE